MVAPVAEPKAENEAAPWPRRLTTIVGKRIKHYRTQRRKLSARELADECERLGHRVEYQVIANMEAGRRTNVALAEVLVLARALEVPPALLVIPVAEWEDVPMLPGIVADPWTAYRWFTGTLTSAVSGDSNWLSDVPEVRTYRRHDDTLARYMVRRDEARADDAGAAAMPAAAAYLDSLVNVRIEIRSRGWRLPPLPESVAAEVETAEKEKGVAQ